MIQECKPHRRPTQINSLNSKVDTLTAATTQLSTEHQNLQTDISDVECTYSEESLELYQNLQNNLTHQLESISDSLEHFAVHTCGGTGGWRRVVYLDMTDSSTTCPSGWQLTTHSKRTCGRATTGSHTCDSTIFPVSGGPYTRVCGRIKAYQYNHPDAFEAYHRGDVTTIDGAYVSGVSLTHGSPRQYIWTFAAGIGETLDSRNDACPCDASINISIPGFVGTDYFCESGVNSPPANYIQTILCGMDKTVVPAAPVAHSTFLHISLSDFPPQPLMILRLESSNWIAVMTLQ